MQGVGGPDRHAFVSAVNEQAAVLASLSKRIAALERAASRRFVGVTVSQNAGASLTLTATPGRGLLIFGYGAWGNSATAGTANLNYNGNVIATHPLKQAAAADRTGLSLIGSVTAVESATCSITVTLGTLYNPVITWLEIG